MSEKAPASFPVLQDTGEKIEVIVYSKPACHLCEEMKDEIRRADCERLYTLHEVNIETDPTLLARYKYDIPVLLIDGVEAFRHRLRAEDFKRRILAKNRD